MSTNESNKENQEVKTEALTDLTVENEEHVKGGDCTGDACNGGNGGIIFGNGGDGSNAASTQKPGHYTWSYINRRPS